jgi:uncharacterized protein (DUF433 family)
MADPELLARVSADPKVFAGKPYIRRARISIAIILDALSHGLTPAEIIEHYPSLEMDDIHAAVAFATALAEKNGGIALVGDQYLQYSYHQL